MESGMTRTRTREDEMIRHRCAACGQPINRLDSFFEPSDGTLCSCCLGRLAPGKPARAEKPAAAMPPTWASLPELSFQSRR